MGPTKSGISNEINSDIHVHVQKCWRPEHKHMLFTNLNALSKARQFTPQVCVAFLWLWLVSDHLIWLNQVRFHAPVSQNNKIYDP